MQSKMPLKRAATAARMSENLSQASRPPLVQVRALPLLIAMIPGIIGDAGEGQGHDQLAVKTQDVDATLSFPMISTTQNVTPQTDQTEGDPTQETIEDTTEMKDRRRDIKAIIRGADLVSLMMTDMMIKRGLKKASKLWVECALGKRRTMKRSTKNSLKKLALIMLNLNKKKKAGKSRKDSNECPAAMKAQKENQ